MQKMTIGSWEVNVGETRFLDGQQVSQLTELVETWSDVEVGIRKNDAVPVKAVSELNVPTILCRVDLAPFGIGETPAEKIFEIEARPAGFGLLLNLFPGFEHIREFWKPLSSVGAVVLGSREVAAEDTKIFSEIMGWQWLSLHECNNGVPDFVWARGSSLDDGNGVNLARLERRALAPLRSHGDKTYLLKMGLADKVGHSSPLPWDEPFVVKPQKGSKSDNVLLWHPTMSKKNGSGLSTKGKIEKTLDEERSFIMQPLILPQAEEQCGKHGFTIWRVYFAYDIRNSSWGFAGGLWNWRQCLKVHGASDSIFGALASS